MTDVIFRRDLCDGVVYALFPDEPSDVRGVYCTVYQHVGQHGQADYQMCVGSSRPAKPEEYADLLAELVDIGYDDLRIKQRRTRR